MTRLFYQSWAVWLSLLTAVASPPGASTRPPAAQAGDLAAPIFTVPSTEKAIVLTFDDGPHPTRTPLVLRALKKHKMKAVFFVLGKNAKRYPGIIQAIVKHGHQVASHGYAHANMKKLSPAQIAKELDDTTAALQAAGAQAFYFRPPYGIYTKSLEKQLALRHLRLVMWSIDSMDWSSKHTAGMTDKITKKLKPGRILLLHDIQAHTATHIDAILSAIDQAGYTTIPLPTAP